MAETLGGRPVDITKEGDKIKVIFHPMNKGVKHPKATTFVIRLSNSDVDTLKKAF